MLEAEGLTKSFEGVTAVRSVSLTVQPGEVVGLVGASGSGKSTLLNLLAGLLDADLGVVRLDKEKVKGPADQLVPGHPQIKLVHQEYQLMPNVTIRENIAFALRYYQRSYLDFRVQQLLSLCRLEHIQHRLPRQVSGGEKQRTAIARAIADEPAVLLLDEPFSHLDLPNRLLIRDVILDLVRNIQAIGRPTSRQPSACLFVTHDATDALSISSRVGILQNGSLVQVGSPLQVYRLPINAYTAQMTGPANVIRAKHLPLLGIQHAYHPNAQVCIRPEQIRIHDKGKFGGTVSNIFFKGAYTEIEVELNRYVRISLLSTQPESVSIGQLVGLELLPNALHWLKG